MTTLKFIPRTFLLLLMAVPFFIACQDKETSPKESNETVQEATLDQKKQMLDNVVPANSANSNSADMGALNPEHGQPGHRCDIAVGAPLNGNAGSPSVTPVQGNNPIQIQSDAAPVKVADGLNPAHGQPGHRCDVKVGDPL